MMQSITQNSSHAQSKKSRDLQEVLLSQGIERRVEVNQRALVDKLLARYKGEFTVFRELIQNADDAKATEIKIEVL
jgi:hypothetical protein